MYSTENRVRENRNGGGFSPATRRPANVRVFRIVNFESVPARPNEMESTNDFGQKRFFSVVIIVIMCYYLRHIIMGATRASVLYTLSDWKCMTRNPFYAVYTTFICMHCLYTTVFPDRSSALLNCNLFIEFNAITGIVGDIFYQNSKWAPTPLNTNSRYNSVYYYFNVYFLYYGMYTIYGVCDVVVDRDFIRCFVSLYRRGCYSGGH